MIELRDSGAGNAFWKPLGDGTRPCGRGVCWRFPPAKCNPPPSAHIRNLCAERWRM